MNPSVSAASDDLSVNAPGLPLTGHRSNSRTNRRKYRQKIEAETSQVHLFYQVDRKTLSSKSNQFSQFLDPVRPPLRPRIRTLAPEETMAEPWTQTGLILVSGRSWPAYQNVLETLPEFSQLNRT
jgi:hypothetical protein